MEMQLLQSYSADKEYGASSKGKMHCKFLAAGESD